MTPWRVDGDGCPGNPPLAKALQAVALDGLSGVGKSTVGRLVASAKEWSYLDTGASYRAVTLAALHAGLVGAGAARVDVAGHDAVVALTEEALAALELTGPPSGPRLYLFGEDRTEEIRSAEVTATVSAVSAVPGVRRLLASWQRWVVLSSRGCVAEGRDIGSVVLPDAPLKVWLTADASERAARRALDVYAPAASLDEVRRSVERRDALDSSRKAAPARPASDAVILDTTGLDVSAVVACLLELMDIRGLGLKR